MKNKTSFVKVYLPEVQGIANRVLHHHNGTAYVKHNKKTYAVKEIDGVFHLTEEFSPQKKKYRERLGDLTGKRFGSLTVIKFHKRERKSYWLCDCDCGKQGVVVLGSALVSGNTKGCGCLRGKGGN